MPQVGERKTVNGVTGEFDGTTWRQVESAPAQESSQEPALARLFGGAMKTSPLNPMNLVRAVQHPVDTLGSMIGTPINEAVQAGKSLADTVTGNGPNGRLISFLDTLKHAGGAVPLVGKAAVDAGTKIGEGDIAGGVGELGGLASGALLPKVPGAIADSLEGLGKGAEALGKSKVLKTGQGHAPLALATGHPVTAAAALLTPPALEYGGRGAQAAAGSLRGLTEAAKTLPGKFGAPVTEEAPRASTIGLDAARQAGDSGWAQDESAVPEGNSPEAVQRGLTQLRSRTNNLKPNYMDQEVAGIANRANTMGQQSVNSLATGYENVPEGGIRSTADIDAMLASRRPTTIEPNAFTGNPASQGLEASLAELRQKAGPQNPAFTEFGSTNDSPLPGEDGSYDLGEISDRPALTNEQLDRIAGDKEAIRNLFNNHFGSKVAGR